MTKHKTINKANDPKGIGDLLRNLPRWTYWIGAVILTVGFFWFATRSDDVYVGDIMTTAYVGQGNMEITVTGPGRIRAANAVTIDVPDNVRGNIQLVYLVTEGIIIQAGDIIAQLDTVNAVQRLENEMDQLETTEASFELLLEDQTNSILDLENDVRSAELSYAQMELQLRNLEFSSVLEQKQGELDMENARISRDESIRKLAAQRIINEAELVQRRINLEGQREDVIETQQELEALTLYAPISGLVIHAEQGRWTSRTKIHEGDDVRRGQDLVKLPDLSLLLMETRINELDAERIHIGQHTRIRFEAFPRLELEGIVTDLSTLAQETQDGGNVRVFPAIITLVENDPRVRPGMTASVDIIVDELDNCVCIPLSAVGVIDQKTYVKIVGEDDPVEVTLGSRNESEAQVLAGLEVGIEIELGWLRDSGAVLGTLAGYSQVPDDVANSIIAQGDEYGSASPVIQMGEQNEGRGSRRGGDRSGMRGMEGMAGMGGMSRMGGGETGMEGMAGMDFSRLSPEMRARLEQMRGEAGENLHEGGEAGAAGAGMGMMGMRRGEAGSDSARTAQTMEMLRGLKEGLPENLQAEIDTIIESGEINFQSISPALMDSLRSRSGFRRVGRRPPPEAGQPPPTTDNYLTEPGSLQPLVDPIRE